MKIHLHACATLILLTLAASSAAWAGTVSATPGIIQGVITFNAPFLPDSVTIDARDSANVYTAQATAAQNGPACFAGSTNWCYSLVVESALASAYYLRPSPNISKTSPVYIASRVPFPPSPLVPITSGATVAYNISYQPGEISGAVAGNDMNGQPLQVSNVYLSVNDLSNTFAEPCGGSLDFCPYNSVFQSGAPPLPAPVNYQLFLKPPDTYNYLSRAIGFAETGGNKTSFQFNSSQPLGATPAAGADNTVNYTLNQVATVTGSLSAPGQSIYDYQVNVDGGTTASGAFYETFGPANISPTPLAQPLTYTARIFDLTDFTQPLYIQPLLTLSTDGTTLLQYPATPVTGLTAGSTLTQNYSGTSATIAGRVTFDPPWSAGNIYPGIESVTQDGGLAQTTLTPDTMGGTYTLPAFGDNWQYWRFGWNFNLQKPGFTSNYLVGQFLSSPAVPDVVVANGGAATANFSFGTALVKVFFSAPATPVGATLSNPQLAITTGSYTNGKFAADYVETGAAAGPGTNVTTAEADAVLRVHGTPFQITPSARINTSPSSPATGPTTFSPVVLSPNKGDVIIVGIPGTLSLVVDSPTNGQVFTTCQIPVTGSATGAQNITITVNGHVVPTNSAGNPNDPQQVLFSTTIPGSGPNTLITVTAAAPGNTSVTDTRKVSATSPTVNVSAQLGTTLLWPPNHDLVNVGLTASAQTACGGTPVLGVMVYSNEGDTADTGTGNFSPDAANIAPGTLRLREERVATDNGRVYLVIATGTAQGGSTGHSCATAVVPHDQSKDSIAAVNALAAAAAATCTSTGQPPAGYVQVGTGPVIGPKQ